MLHLILISLILIVIFSICEVWNNNWQLKKFFSRMEMTKIENDRVCAVLIFLVT